MQPNCLFTNDPVAVRGVKISGWIAKVNMLRSQRDPEKKTAYLQRKIKKDLFIVLLGASRF